MADMTVTKSQADEGVVVINSKDEVQHSWRLGRPRCSAWSEKFGEQLKLSRKHGERVRRRQSWKNWFVQNHWQIWEINSCI